MKKAANPKVGQKKQTPKLGLLVITTVSYYRNTKGARKSMVFMKPCLDFYFHFIFIFGQISSCCPG